MSTESITPTEHARPGFARAWVRRRKKPGSIRRSIVRILLVPAIPLIALSVGGAAYLVGTGYSVRAIAVSVRQVSLPAVAGLASLEKERSLSLAVLAQPSTSPQQLAAQRQHTDRELNAMRQAAEKALAHAPDQIADRMRALTTRLDRLPSVRAQVDAGSISPHDAAAYYNQVMQVAGRLFDAQARLIPDAGATQGALAATALFRISDLMSRAAGTATTALASGRISSGDARAFARLVDVYHQRLTTVAPTLRPDVRTSATRLVHSDAWTTLTADEDTLIAAGSWRGHAPAGLPTTAEWTKLAGTVSDQLIALTREQADEVSAQALADGTSRLLLAALGSAAALLVVAAAIVLAVRQSGTLVHGTLLPRIRTLGEDADRLVSRYVDLLDRMRRGEQVDLAEAQLRLTVTPASSLHDSDDGQGDDEIAQVATVLNRALAAAVEAAVREAQGRDGARQAVLGIARRHQRPLHQTLRHLHAWEQTEQNPDRMDRWFTLHHLANQIRSLTDGLIILSGGRPGRQYRRDQTLLEVLRLAQADAVQYQRVTVETPPEALVSGSAISQIVPLLTRLLDNALGFSDPSSPVTMRSMRVAAGVVVEIEDRGAGMSPEAQEQANHLLREAPDFHVADLGTGTRLGLWVVAHLAHRLGITVELRDSPYGGVRAIVLLPTRLLNVPSLAPSRDRDPNQDPNQDHEPPTDAAGISAGDAGGITRHAPAPARPPSTGTTPPLVAVSGASLGGLPPHPSGGRYGHPHARPTMPSPSVPPSSPGPRPDLPERQRGRHLAPQLRSTSGEQTGPAQQTSPEPPDQTRSRLAAFQRGSRAGRGHHPISTDTERNETHP